MRARRERRWPAECQHRPYAAAGSWGRLPSHSGRCHSRPGSARAPSPGTRSGRLWWSALADPLQDWSLSLNLVPLKLRRLDLAAPLDLGCHVPRLLTPAQLVSRLDPAR
jgi:hypothetical protein